MSPAIEAAMTPGCPDNSGKPPQRTESGRCAFCDGSGFSYDGFRRAYVCMCCGGLKPERARVAQGRP